MIWRFIKFILWGLTVVIVAYYITDINISGKTIKQHIDQWMASGLGLEIKSKFDQAFEGAQTITKKAPPLPDLPEEVPQVMKKIMEIDKVQQQQVDQIEEIIQKSQGTEKK